MGSLKRRGGNTHGGSRDERSFPRRIAEGVRATQEGTIADNAVRQLARLGEYAEKVAPFRDELFERISPQPRTIRLMVASTSIRKAEFDFHKVSFQGPLTAAGGRKLVVEPSTEDDPSFIWKLARFKRPAQVRLQRFVEGSVARALKAKAQVLVVNEMGFPSCPPNFSPESAGDVYRHFFTKLLRKPLGWNANPLYVVPGSTHCLDRYTNSAPIYQYKGGTRREPSDRRFAFKVYNKNTSATKVHEFLHIPSDRTLACIQIGEVTVTPLICLDLYDATQLFSIVRRNLLFDFHFALAVGKGIQRRVDIIIVPSYGMQQEKLPLVLAMLQRLSLLVGCVVVLAHSNETANEQHAFCFGKDASPNPDEPIPGVRFRRFRDKQHALLQIGYSDLLEMIARSKEPGGTRAEVDALFNHGAAKDGVDKVRR